MIENRPRKRRRKHSLDNHDFVNLDNVPLTPLDV